MAKVLIVDDEVGIREWLTEILEDEGYQVACAEHAAASNRQLELGLPDVILLDIWMPDVDGITLLRQWKERYPALPPVVMVSGHATIELAVQAMSIGAFGVLEKPIAMQKLLEVLKQAIVKRRGQSEKGCVGDGARLPAVLRTVWEKAQESLRQHGWVRLHASDDFFLRWLLPAFDQQRTPVRIDEQHTVSTELFASWRERTAVAVLGEHANRLQAKNVAFVMQHAPARRIPVVLVSIEGVTPIAHWATQGGARLEMALTAEAVPVPGRREAQARWPSLVSEGLAHLLGKEVSLATEAEALLQRLGIPSSMDFAAAIEALANEIDNGTLTAEAVTRALAPATADGGLAHLFALPLKEAREAFERLYLERLLARQEVPMQRLAELAGLERTHLYRKLRQLGLEPRRNGEE